MDIISVFFIVSVSVAGSAFLGHAIGYRRGRKSIKSDHLNQYRRGFEAGHLKGRTADNPVLKALIEDHNKRIGL